MLGVFGWCVGCVWRIGDWLISGVRGELYSCKDDIFRATYDEVSQEELVEEFQGIPSGKRKIGSVL